MSDLIRVWYITLSNGLGLVRTRPDPYQYFKSVELSYHEEMRQSTMLEY